ncbi:MAG: hypothetical protein ACQERB_01725 [Promethearchaeati archaeon]
MRDKDLKNLLDEQIDIFGITTVSIYEIFIDLERIKRKRSKERYDEL